MASGLSTPPTLPVGERNTTLTDSGATCASTRGGRRGVARRAQTVSDGQVAKAARRGRSPRHRKDSSSESRIAGTMLGRYRIERRIGAGGMGVVLEAYDLMLERTVALKVVRPSMGGRRAQRHLFREAQLLAKVRHPNVVAIHDVGVLGRDVFVAMEYVPGQSLKSWLAQEPRSAAEILEKFRAVGTGLAAAHRAGLVHRDVKPGNVIVGDDGRVQVIDFGLARPIEEHSTRASSEGEGRAASDGLLPELAAWLTQAWGRAGTPQYMSPEQHRGGKVSHKSDQFSFCVALYEALYDQHPFGFGESTLEPALAVRTALRPAPRRGRSVPDRVRRAIERGLSHKPRDRFSTMDSLVAALAVRPGHRRRLLFVATGAALALAAGATWADARRAAGAARCSGAAGELAGVWDEKVRRDVRASWRESGSRYAGETLGRVELALDRYTGEWASMRTKACEATHVYGVQSSELLDRRIGCLNRINHKVSALTDWLQATPDERVIRRAVDATLAATDMSRCEDEATLLATGTNRMPEDERSRARLVALQQKIAEVEVLFETARYREGVEQGLRLVSEADALGYAPAQTDLALVMGDLFTKLGQFERAEESFARGIEFATRTGDSVQQALLIAKQIWSVGYCQGRHDEVSVLVPHAEAAIVRAGDSSRARGALASALGGVAMARRDYAAARNHFERGLAYDDQARVDDGKRASRWYNLGVVLQNMDEDELALRYFHKALATWKELLGPEHPEVAKALIGIGESLRNQGKLEEALTYWRRGLAVGEARLSPDHHVIGIALHNIGNALNDLERFSQSIPYHKRALGVVEAALGPDHEHTGVVLTSMGVAQAALGQSVLAVASLERAVNVLEAIESPYLPEAQFALALALWKGGGDRRRAIELARESRPAWDRHDGDAGSKRGGSDWFKARSALTKAAARR